MHEHGLEIYLKKFISINTLNASQKKTDISKESYDFLGSFYRPSHRVFFLPKITISQIFSMKPSLHSRRIQCIVHWAAAWLAVVLLLVIVPGAQATITAPDLEKLYITYYGRPADPVGLNYWLNTAEAAVAAGGDETAILASISNSFGASSEYTAAYAGLNSNAIIDKVYNNLFSHSPDPGGLLYWSQKLSSGALTLGQIARAISDSAVLAGNTDGTTFLNKVSAATAFTAAVDTTTEILGYTGAAAGNLAKAWISGITDDASLAAAIAPAALDATVLNVTTAGMTTYPITSVSGPSSGHYSLGQKLNFTVNYPTALTVTGTPQMVLTIGSTTRYASYASGSPGTALVFSYNVQANDSDADGIAVSSPLQLNGGTIKADTTGTGALSFTPPTTAGVLVDPAPIVQSVSGPSAGVYGTWFPLSFTVNYDGAVTVTGTPQMVLTIGSTTRYANYVSGNSGTALVFECWVQLGDTDSDGIAVSSPLQLNGGTITSATNNANASLTFTPPVTTGVWVDTSNPSINISSPSTGITSTGPVTYTLTYNDANPISVYLQYFDILLNSVGDANGSVSVTGSDNTWTVTISNITGNGLLGISVAPFTATDLALNYADPAGPSIPFFVANGQTPFQTWAILNGFSTDPVSRGNNGIVNLLNFAFGVDPVKGGGGALRYTGTLAGSGTLTATGQPITRIENTDRRALFCRRSDFINAGVTYTVQFSTDLKQWVNSGVTPTVLADDRTNQIVSVPYPSNAGNKAQFFRINVTHP